MKALTQAAFELLLARLDSNRQEAGNKYELLRRKLVKFFEWRGSIFPEDLADDTINRVATNLEAGEDVRDLLAYSAGTARNIFLESLRAHRMEPLEDIPEVPSALNDEAECRLECLDACLRKLSPEEAGLIRDYYQSEQPNRIASRKMLAARMGIPLNALRIRAHRIRMRLEECVETCMQQGKFE